MNSDIQFGSAKAWYQRPRVIDEPDGFIDLLDTTMRTLRTAAAHSPCVFASSLSSEDMAIFHMIASANLSIHTFALDTQRLPSATLALWKHAEAHYVRPIERVSGTFLELCKLAETQPDSDIYETRTARELCCSVRKTEPLRRTLAGKKSWVTGLRKSQSAGRANVSSQEWDAGFGLEKFNPIADWSDEALWYFIEQQKIPVNTLYDKGYASIGCDPCTRPIRFNEHPRAGRWWWEAAAAANGSATECGIHVVAHKDYSPNQEKKATV